MYIGSDVVDSVSAAFPEGLMDCIEDMKIVDVAETVASELFPCQV